MLKIISEAMDALEIPYEFKKWHGKIPQMYFTGEYQEVESMEEDGEQETQFILNGYARGERAIAELEKAKNKIKKYFPQVGGRLATTDSGSRVAIFYASTFGNLSTPDAELEKIQINLKVKEWSVI